MTGVMAGNSSQKLGRLYKIVGRFLEEPSTLNPWNDIPFKAMTDPWDDPSNLLVATWMVDFYGFHVGKYTSPMDGKGYAGCE